MIRAAALALAVALAAPARAADDPLARFDEELRALEQRLVQLEAALTPPEEPAASRAARRVEAGERRFAVGDFAGAAAALQVAVDDPEVRRSPRLAATLFQLGESLRRQGRHAAALARFQELLRMDGAPLRREALPRAMECALALGRPADVPRLLDQARAALGVEPPPPEALWLAAKAAWRRADLPAAQRWPAARAAAQAVPAPWSLHAAYVEGAASVQEGALERAEATFGRCLGLEARDAGQREVRELCRLALARLAAEQGRWEDADRSYREIPRGSPRFAEALQEHAGAAVRAGRLDDAARLSGLLPDLRPESPLAPRSGLLRGHLLLRAGRPDEAIASFDRVVRAYAPLRDELDRALASRAQPARWFAALAGAAPGRAEPPPLPRIALRWARDRDGVREVLAAAGALGDAQKELAEAKRHAQRVEGILARNYGLGAFPALEERYARAEAIENGAMRAAGTLAALLSEAMAPDDDAGLGAARAERRLLEGRVAQLPSSSDQMASRQRADRQRLAGLAREVVELRARLQVNAAALDDADVALFARPQALGAERSGLAAELAAHRRVLARDQAELDQLADRVARASDGAPSAGRPAEDHLRAAYRAALDRELDLASHVASQRSVLPAIVARADRLRGRAGDLEIRADKAKRAILKEARVRAAGLRDELAREQAALAAEERKLDGVRGEAERTVGKASERIFRDVRRRLHEVVLQADVGVVDVAWAQKQRALGRLQGTAAEAAAEQAALEREVARSHGGTP